MPALSNVSYWRKPLSLLALAAILAGTSLSAALVPAERFQANAVMRDETRSLINYLEHSHYLRQSLDQTDFSKLVDEFLKSLDPKRLYFTEREVKDAEATYAPQFAKGLEKGQIDPAFQLFLDFRRRVMERNQWILQRLDQPFDFAGTSSYEPDRSKASWPLNGRELNALWEAQIKYDVLNEMLFSMVPYKSSQAGTSAVLNLPRNQKAQNKPEDDKEPLAEAEALKEAVSTVRKRYERSLQWIEETEPVEVQEIFLSTLARLYDPHSTFMSSTTLEEFSMAIRNSLVGIGAVLSDVDGYCTIKELLPGGPAERSGQLKAEDQIIGVAQGKDGEMVDVIGMRLRKIVQMIRGSKNTEVRLLVRPANADPSERKVVSITRDEVKLTEQLAQAQLYTLPSPENKDKSLKIGVINLPAFYGASQGGAPGNTTTDDVAELISKLKKDGMQGLVLDLRNNGGGLLGEAISLTGLFLPVGPVVQVRNSRGQVQDYMDEDPSVAWEGPLMVLVSRFSASASEIAAGALRDNNRALIVGDDTTHGKGTVQAVFDMNRQNFFSMMRTSNRGAAKITVQKYYLPRGDSTQIDGVRSDIVLPSLNKFLPVGEGDLPNAMVHDSIEPVKWDFMAFAELPISRITPELVTSLRDASTLRQDSLPEFTHLQTSIDYQRKRQDEKKLSLNLENRLNQRQEDKAFRDEIDAKFAELEKDPYPFTKVLLDTAIKQQAEHDELMAKRKLETEAIPAVPPVVLADDAPATATGEAPTQTGQELRGKIESGFDNLVKQEPFEQSASAKAQADTADAAPDSATAKDTTAKSQSATPVDAEEEELSQLEDKRGQESDIHLREALRIMSDWLAQRPGNNARTQIAADTTPANKSKAPAN